MFQDFIFPERDIAPCAPQLLRQRASIFVHIHWMRFVAPQTSIFFCIQVASSHKWNVTDYFELFNGASQNILRHCAAMKPENSVSKTVASFGWLVMCSTHEQCWSFWQWYGFESTRSCCCNTFSFQKIPEVKLKSFKKKQSILNWCFWIRRIGRILGR